jgi:flagellar hook-length control protein FliK
VTRSFQITQQNGFTEAKISLVPEHLGQVDIKLSMHNGQLTAQIVTETAAGREALEQQLGVLRSALQAQGIQVEKLEITQQSHTAASFSFLKDHGQQQSARQFQQQSSSRSAGYEEETIDFHEELELIDSEYETVYRGRAFHAMA